MGKHAFGSPGYIGVGSCQLLVQYACQRIEDGDIVSRGSSLRQHWQVTGRSLASH